MLEHLDIMYGEYWLCFVEHQTQIHDFVTLLELFTVLMYVVNEYTHIH